MNKTLSVFAPGTTVTLVKAKFDVTVEQVHIFENDTVEYDVVYWSGQDRKVANVAASEVEAISTSKQAKIGFVQ